jgi:hypothetical protein
MDNALEEAFESVPHRLYVVNMVTMEISYASNLGPHNPMGKVIAALQALPLPQAMMPAVQSQKQQQGAPDTGVPTP